MCVNNPPNAIAPILANTARLIAEQTSNPEAIVQSALAQLVEDKSALLSDEVIEAFKVIRAKDPLAYERHKSKAHGFKTLLDKLTATGSDAQDQNNPDVFIAKVSNACTLGHDADGRGIAIVEVNDIQMSWYINSEGFGDWLRSKYYDDFQKGISDQILATVINTLAAIGNYKGKQYSLHLRCASHQDAIYIDLCNDQWQVIKVDATGWQLLKKSPVMFTRNKNMRPLPTPEKSGDLTILWKYLNIPEKDQLRVLCWLFDSYRSDTPYPILELVGEQGSAKSSTQRHLRDLTDPNKVALRGRPKSVEDIYVSAANNHVVSFENLSFLSPDQQDACCTLATGGGFATRQLYTNGEESVLETKRPLIINGINHVATQPDMTERTLTIELPVISMENRRDELSLDAGWQQDYPVIFAGVLNLFSKALAILPNVKLEKKYRMADFQKLGEAVAQALGHPAGHFSKLYGESVADGVDRSLETYGISNALQVLIADQKTGVWEGTVLALKASLECLHGVDRSNWPKSPRGLANQIKRIAPGLRRYGITIEHLGHSNQGSKLRIALLQEDKNP